MAKHMQKLSRKVTVSSKLAWKKTDGWTDRHDGLQYLSH